MASSWAAFCAPTVLRSTRPRLAQLSQRHANCSRLRKRSPRFLTSASVSASQTKLPTASSHSSHGNLRHSRIIARTVWESAVTPGAVCIDATCGKGSDTLQLARLAGPTGLIHAFDIQHAAVEETIARISEAVTASESLAPVRAVVQCHAHFAGLERIEEGSVAAIVYNLGWFPGKDADKRVVTRTSTTLASLREAARLIKVGGVITLMAYIGHPEGPAEAEAVAEWASKLDVKMWSVVNVSYPNRTDSPSLYVFERVARDDE
jgi:hypothetical protein